MSKYIYVSPEMDRKDIPAGMNAYSTKEMHYVLNIISGAYVLGFLPHEEYEEIAHGFPIKDQPFKSLYKQADRCAANDENATGRVDPHLQFCRVTEVLS